MRTGIELMIAYLEGWAMVNDTIPISKAIEIAKGYALSEDKPVTELNERNSVDEGEKSFPHTCACGNEKKSWYKTCDKCWHKEKSQ